MKALVSGIVAGYGIAIPVGAIAVLIVQTGIRSGFTRAAAAGAGAASADLFYALVAVVGGSAVADSIDSVETPFRWVSGAVLLAIGVMGLVRGRRQTEAALSSPLPRGGEVVTYLRFLGLTIINPLTVIFFAAFVVGTGLAGELTGVDRGLFVAGVFGASLSWQTFLAGIGAVARHRLSDRFRATAILVGNLIVIALAVYVVVR